MAVYHPWRQLRGMTDVVVHWISPGPGIPGATDGLGRIWVDPGLSQAERRCVLAHELVHLEAGHTGCQPSSVESKVREATARRLISLEALTAAVRWTVDVCELAEELWVTPLVLTDRAAALTPTELRAVTAASAHHR